jgi:hypothetical protein
MSRVEEFLKGSRTGCQYRCNPISCTSLLPCQAEAVGSSPVVPAILFKYLQP